MRSDSRCIWLMLALLGAQAVYALRTGQPASAQEQMPPPRVQPEPQLLLPAPGPYDRPLPINLPTALQLANVRPIDVAVASERIRLAVAALERAQVLWLPTVYAGVDYFRHDGQIQETPGNVFGTSKSSFMVGAGPSMVFALSDAL